MVVVEQRHSRGRGPSAAQQALRPQQQQAQQQDTPQQVMGMEV